MKCEKCKSNLEFYKEYRLDVFDQYVLFFEFSSYRDNKIDPKVYALFTYFIDYIKKHDNLDIFTNLPYFFNEEIIVTCKTCNSENKLSPSLSLHYEFYLFAERYIYFIIDNIVMKHTNKNISDFSVNINELNLHVFVENIPDVYKKEKKLINKLLKLMNMLSEKGGGEFELLEWFLEQFKLQVFGVILGLIILKGIGNIGEAINGIKIKYEIRKRIKKGIHYWADIDIETLKKYISIPKEYKKSKEELIENILKIKFDEYKNEIIEKLK